MIFLVRYSPEYMAPFSVEIGQRAIVGRGSDRCSVVVRNKLVSKRHCALSVKGAYGWIEDLGSSNGTFVNGERVQSSPVSPGDVITVGGCEIQVG